MKRIIISVTCLVFFASITRAQLFVDARGNVGVKPLNLTLDNCFSINGNGASNICAYILSDSAAHDIGLKITKSGGEGTTNNFNYLRGVESNVRLSSNSCDMEYGLYIQSFRTGGLDGNGGRSYGVCAIAGNTTSGWNYGLFGNIIGNNNGAAVYGSSVSWNSGMELDDRYAGFFHGKVKSTNAVYATAFNVSSDYRLKENIKKIKSECIDNIMRLNVVSYNLKPRMVSSGDTTTTLVSYYANDSELLQKDHYGLIAQELREIYPDLVYEGSDGYLSVNYIEIIPLLIKSIQELRLQVDELTYSPEKAVLRNGGTTNTDDIIYSAVLYQNNPNPFTENTSIKCVIPQDVAKADLYIYDMNGHQIESRNIGQRGNVSLLIEGNSLDAGMYLYSLITDGTVVDTKRMILTR